MVKRAVSRFVAHVFVLALAFGGTSTLLAQDTTGVGAITGAVLTADRRPVADARVCALRTSACATTAADGRFRIADLRAGAYPI